MFNVLPNPFCTHVPGSFVLTSVGFGLVVSVLVACVAPPNGPTRYEHKYVMSHAALRQVKPVTRTGFDVNRHSQQRSVESRSLATDEAQDGTGRGTSLRHGFGFVPEHVTRPHASTIKGASILNNIMVCMSLPPSFVSIFCEIMSRLMHMGSDLMETR